MPRVPSRVAVTLVVAFGALTGCAHSPWPDEPGVPVEVSHADNLRAGEAFLAELTARRARLSLAAPIVTPALQRALLAAAKALQVGTASVAKVREAALRWGQSVYRGAVDVWILDCAPGRAMRLPPTLVQRPTLMLSFVAAHFRPRSMAEDQCAIVVVNAVEIVGRQTAIPPLTL